jgi:NAD(P)H-dependent flavin oxidoreductase YrpB (nitropropane dioxygenase family)
MRSMNDRLSKSRSIAIAAISAAAATMIAASAAQAACGSGALGTTHSSRCSNSWISGSPRRNDSTSNDYRLGTLKSNEHRSSEGSRYDLGNARRPNGWDRRTNPGRGTFRPK